MTSAHAEDERIVLFGVDIHRVCVGDAEPTLAHVCHLAVRSPEDVLVIEEVARGFEIVRAGNVDAEPRAREREQPLLDDRDRFAAAVDFVLRSDAEDLLPDVEQLGAVHVLERQVVAEAEDLAVDEVHVLAIGVLDREVVAPGEDSLT
jgi:hypothetical protein